MNTCKIYFHIRSIRKYNNVGGQIIRGSARIHVINSLICVWINDILLKGLFSQILLLVSLLLFFTENDNNDEWNDTVLPWPGNSPDMNPKHVGTYETSGCERSNYHHRQLIETFIREWHHQTKLREYAKKCIEYTLTHRSFYSLFLILQQRHR